MIASAYIGRKRNTPSLDRIKNKSPRGNGDDINSLDGLYVFGEEEGDGEISTVANKKDLLMARKQVILKNNLIDLIKIDKYWQL